jgi:pimeloyl-ACP methyl ester carboxylesterase
MSTQDFSNFIEVDDRKIHYLLAGKDHSQTILLLHGWPTSSYLWRNIVKGLAKDYQVIAIDLPGFGQSDKHLEDSYSFRYYERILNGFLNQLEIQKITLGVHDLGGPIGLYWAIHNMDRLDRLILFNTLVYPQFSTAVKLFGLAVRVPIIKNWLSGPSGIKWAMNFGVHQKQNLTEEAIKQYQESFQEKNARKVLLKTAQRLSSKGFQEIADKLQHFHGPVQIIYGEKDRILPKVADTMSRVQDDLPQAQVKTFPDAGHFLQEEVSEEIVKVLEEFMK